jgi:hypothetical protein
MMHFTDITGLAGVALVIVALALRVPFCARLNYKQKMMLAAGLLIALAIPIGGLSAVEFMRGITADLSVTTLLLLTLALLPSPLGGGIEGEGEPYAIRKNKNSLLALIAIAAIALYPFALGLSTFDPYRLGFGNLWFIAGLLLVAVVAWLRQYTLIALSISLAVLAWSVGWNESNNLWNYLLDPWVAIYALVVLVKNGVCFVSRSKSS